MNPHLQGSKNLTRVEKNEPHSTPQPRSQLKSF